MDFIKKHKLVSGLAIFLIAFIFVGIIMFFILSKENGETYGNRLKGIENRKISADTETQIESEIKNFDKVKKVEYSLKGRLINILITVDKDLKLSKAKEYGNKTLTFFDEEELAFYDVQIMILSEEDSDTYPAIGYKHKSGKKIYWVNKTKK